MKKSALVLAGAGLALSMSANTFATEVYSSDFESGIDSAWSGSTPSSYNSNFSNFLGRMGNDVTSFSLDGLGSGTKEITVTFDLYLIDSWDGDSWIWGTDKFNVGGDYNQSWILPDESSDLNYDSSQKGYLGYSFWQDQIFRGASFSFLHTGDDLTLDFFGDGLQHLDDESWGLDNFSVSATSVPEPGTLGLFAGGLLGLGLLRRKHNG